MQIHQVVVSASPGDAITNYALELRELLRQIGPSDIYARYFDPSMAADIKPLRRYAMRQSSRPEQDVLLFHASIGEPAIRSFLEERPERLVLIYHNISPPESFRPYDPAFSGLLEAGRSDVLALRDRVTMAIAVSEFNARELRDIGYRDVRVVPLIVDARRLHAIPPDPDMSHHLSHGVEGPVVLFVGQVLPHKRPDLLIQAYHVLITHLLPDANLMIVGATRLPHYRDALQLLIRELNLGRAWLTGSVSDGALAALYRRADLFVTASEHEGFCVPLLEAMAFGVPVVARACAAVPETVGDSALLLPAEASSVLLAEAVATGLTDDALRTELNTRAARRLVDFDPDRARASVLAHLLDVV